MTPIWDIRNKIKEQNKYVPKRRANRGRLPAQGLMAGETKKLPGDIIITESGLVIEVR